MTQVSRSPLPKTLEIQMHTLFRKALAELKTEEDIGLLLEDLLSPTEKMMLGKRLAIATLLERGFDQRSVHQIMKVSVATVNHVNFWLKQQGNGYRKVIEKFKRERWWIDLFDEMGEFIEDLYHMKRSPNPIIREYSPTDRII